MSGLRRRDLIRRSLAHYWRTHLAVGLGVATAVAVLAGALLVGDSVRGSLRALVLDRLGRADLAVVSDAFFGEALAAGVGGHPAFSEAFDGVGPLVLVPGLVTEQASGRRVGDVWVYGVDDRFWRFHGVSGVRGPAGREALLSPALAAETGAAEGGSLLVRIQRPSAVPLESLHGRRDETASALRLTVGGIVPPEALGEFSLAPQQGAVRALFVPLALLQESLETPGRVNVLLVAAAPGTPADGRAARLEAIVAAEASLADAGLRVEALDDRGVVAVGADAGLLDDPARDAVEQALTGSDLDGRRLFTYLANTIRSGDRAVPYSLVTATDLATVAPGLPPAAGGDPPPIVLTDWAAVDLGAAPGDPVTLDYYVWEEPGRLVTRSAGFRVAAVVPVGVGDPDLAPVYPGISTSASLVDWDPPFAIDLGRIRPVDEEYWDRYRTTPKAYVPLETGQALWGSRYGSLTSVRVTPPPGQTPGTLAPLLADRLRAALPSLPASMAVRDVRADGLAAAAGTTDFGAYFVYFSFFLVVSALLLAALFFKLGVEQRVREVGLLRAVGAAPGTVRRLLGGEALVVASAGSALGVLGALGYAWLMMLGLRSWWVGAVGTTALTLHVSPVSLAAGAAGGVAAAVACLWWTLRALDRVSARGLLAGQLTTDTLDDDGQRPRPPAASAVLAVAGAVLLGAGVAGWVAPAGAFFGAGSVFLVAALGVVRWWLRRRSRGAVGGHGWVPVSRLGLRYAAYRPGRSVLAIAVIASATFTLVAVDAFRRGEVSAEAGQGTGLGGYALRVETLAPIAHDPASAEGRDALNLVDLDAATRLTPFRVRPGDDASCLNLYQPQTPRIVAPTDAFLAEGRFAFQDALAATDAEAANPWLLLQQDLPDGAIPVIADANSMTYVLHRGLGEDLVIPYGDGELRLRLVAALRDSIFQGELVMGETHFRRLFPEQEGYRLLLVETPSGAAAAAAATLERGLANHGADAVDTAAYLARFHQVENTFLSTFQTLGGLGLLLGTVGLATVLLRNVLERRHELALLGAVGYRRRHFLLMVTAENALLLAGGVLTGALCAGLAIAPAVAERGGRLPVAGGGAVLLFAVVLTGLLSSVVATRVATRGPLLRSLRSE